MSDRPDPWSEGNYDLKGFLDRVSDEQLAGMGVSRTDSVEEIIAKVKGQATRDWIDDEELLEEMVVQAQEAIALYPDNRVEGMARYYGETMQDLMQADDPDDIDGERMLMLFCFATFKLAESRNAMAAMMDGNRRAPHKG